METPAVIAAQNAFAAAKIESESRKQAAIAATMKLPMPEHLAAVRTAERTYH
jgi:hypothetical protein